MANSWKGHLSQVTGPLSSIWGIYQGDGYENNFCTHLGVGLQGPWQVGGRLFCKWWRFFLNPCGLRRGSFDPQFGQVCTHEDGLWANVWELFGTHLERGLGQTARGDLLANLGGQEGSGKRIFFAWLNGQVGQEGQELDLNKFPRTSPEGSEDRLGELNGGRRVGPALEGPGAWGGGGPSPRGWEGGQRALPPGGAPSCCGSDVVLRARAPGSRGILATALRRRGWGQLKGITLHPVSASGQEPPPPTHPAEPCRHDPSR